MDTEGLSFVSRYNEVKEVELAYLWVKVVGVELLDGETIFF
ncbi:MAG: hypothetical protein O3A33_03000 [Chloroflexi bacterium]|nr:hypothetical protein [Chloroflexota bacterium]